MDECEIRKSIDFTRKLIKNVSVDNLITNIHENIDIMGIGESKINLLKNKGNFKKNDKREMFFVLMDLSKQLLTIKNGEPLCKYEALMHWRKYTMSLEEDLLIVANAVYDTLYYKKAIENFNWKLVVNHDNDELNEILRKGMVDNHYHLWGSIPLFKCTWTYLMNNVDKLETLTFLKKLNNNKEVNIHRLLIQAALIRFYLFYQLNQDSIKYYGNKKQKKIVYLIKNSNQLVDKRMEIQEYINCMKVDKNLFGKDTEYKDYICCNKEDLSNNMYQEYSSERKFLYEIMLKIMDLNQVDSECINMFHAYLVIKEKIRSIIVQSAENKGFDDFYKITANKNGIINLYNNPRRLLYPYIKNEINQENIVKLEIRIRIEESSNKMADYIQQLDELIDPYGTYRHLIKYIVHFSRKIDEVTNDNELYRDFYKRATIQKQAEVIKDFFDKYNEVSKRVVGIDVCSSELNFKPEVFANVFRSSDFILYNNVKRTYHVGEEYNDLLDGLRSIDECVSFFDLRKDDRLSHALPLAIDIASWYKERDYIANTSKEQYLDNIVWIYFKLKDREEFKDLLNLLSEEFEKFFYEIYICNFSKNILKRFFNMKKRRELLKKRKDLELEGFTIEEFYHAWLMRKETPQSILDKLWVKLSGRDNYKDLKTFFLAINYFYNSGIKESGKEIINIKIGERMLQGIIEVQKQMQQKIKCKGINIEICPSSNVIIGNVQDYSNHPIVKLYSEGLVSINKDVNSPQINVSINTDDQGIFCTSLKNEYSLIANAFEMLKDKNGKSLYDKKSVYKWIDNMRKNGLKMSF